MSNYIIKPMNLRHEAGRGYISFGFQPTGYWSDVITVRFQAPWSRDDSQPWRLEISNSSGGREKEIGDLEATGYFIEAYQAARELAQRLLDNEAKYQSYFQFKCRKEQERCDAERQAKEAARDADKPIGTQMAEVIVQGMKDRINKEIAESKFGGPVFMTFKYRGTNNTFTVRLSQPGYSKTTRFSVKDDEYGWKEFESISRPKLVAMIADQASVEHFAMSKAS